MTATACGLCSWRRPVVALTNSTMCASTRFSASPPPPSASGIAHDTSDRLPERHIVGDHTPPARRVGPVSRSSSAHLHSSAGEHCGGSFVSRIPGEPTWQPQQELAGVRCLQDRSAAGQEIEHAQISSKAYLHPPQADWSPVRNPAAVAFLDPIVGQPRLGPKVPEISGSPSCYQWRIRLRSNP